MWIYSGLANGLALGVVGVSDLSSPGWNSKAVAKLVVLSAVSGIGLPSIGLSFVTVDFRFAASKGSWTSFATLITKSTTFKGSSLMEIIATGVNPNKLVIGKPLVRLYLGPDCLELNYF